MKKKLHNLYVRELDPTDSLLPNARIWEATLEENQILPSATIIFSNEKSTIQIDSYECEAVYIRTFENISIENLFKEAKEILITEITAGIM